MLHLATYMFLMTVLMVAGGIGIGEWSCRAFTYQRPLWQNAANIIGIVLTTGAMAVGFTVLLYSSAQ